MARQARTDFTANDKTKGAFKSLTGSMNSLRPTMVAGMAAIGTATAMLTQKVLQLPAKAAQAFQETAREMDDLAKSAKRLEIPVELLDGLTHAAELSGAGARDLETAFRTASKQISDASQGIGEGKRYLDDLGISVEDANGRMITADELILQFADRMDDLKGSAERSAAAQALFGRSGTRLLPMLEAGSQGIKEMVSEAAGLGLRTGEMTASAEEVIDAQLRWNKAMRAFTDLAFSSVMPVITDMANWLSEKLAGAVSDVNKEMREWIKMQELSGEEGYTALIEKGQELYGQMADLRQRSNELQAQFEQMLKSPGARGSDSVNQQLLETAGKLADVEAEYNAVRDAIRSVVEADDKAAAAAQRSKEIAAERASAAEREAYARLLEEDQKGGLLKPGSSGESPLKKLQVDAEEIATNAAPQITEALTETQQTAIETADIFSQRMGNAFASVITGSQTAGQAMKSVFLGVIGDIAAEMTRKLVLQGLLSIIPGGGSLIGALSLGRGAAGGLPSLAPAVNASAPGGVVLNLNSFAPITTADQITAAVNLQDAQAVQSLFEVVE